MSKHKNWIGISTAIAISSIGMLLGLANAENSLHEFGYDDYGTILNIYVDKNGMVNYRELKANSDKLDIFTESLGKLQPATYKAWSDKEKVAFWINAYNGFTLKAIIDHYPIKSSFFKARLYPKNSIRQIKGVWDKLKFPIMGKKRTLNDIEHKILRKEFNEPRIHMALVCAAMGCPPLRNEPYTGRQLDDQLDDQTRQFLGNASKFLIDRRNKRIYLSAIFKWFGEDFVPTYHTDRKFIEYNKTERAVLNFINRYLSEEEQEYLATHKLSVKHLDYDWSLNEQ